MKKFPAIIGAMFLGTSAFAAGVDSRTYSCPALQALVAANRFVFINTPGFGDFVVADASSCSGGEFMQRRSVPTADNPECLVTYCKARGGFGGN